MNKKLEYSIIAGIVLVVIVISVMVGINNIKKASTYTYQGRTDNFSFQITRTNDFTQHFLQVFTQENGLTHEKLIPFQYGPKELQNIYLEKDIYKKVVGDQTSKTKIFLTQDIKLISITNQSSVIAEQEIGKVTGTANYSVFKIPTKAAFTYNDGTLTLTADQVIDCKYANSKVAVILFQLGNETKIYSENECVIVQGKDSDGIKKAATKLSYHLLGVF
jgi:hypothetical protein